uniref:Putative secreted peptide n=1 Tax=Rhipicephalus pulchellus TaxID=72859 RepID=L7M8Y2_RHIPC
MKSTVASATLLVVFAIFLVSHAEDSTSDDGSTEGSEEHEVNFCKNETTDQKRNETLVCVLNEDDEDARRLQTYMKSSGTNHTEIANLICNNTNKLNAEILKSENKSITDNDEPDLYNLFLKCEAYNLTFLRQIPHNLV